MYNRVVLIEYKVYKTGDINMYRTPEDVLTGDKYKVCTTGGANVCTTEVLSEEKYKVCTIGGANICTTEVLSEEKYKVRVCTHRG